MKTTKFHVRETFTTRLLGTAPADKEVYQEFIAKKRADLEERKRKMEVRSGNPSQPTPGTVVEEVETINEEAGITVFHSDVGQTTESGEAGKGLFLLDYQIGGYWKEAAEILGPEHGVKQPRSKLDNYLLIEPRRVYIHAADGAVLTKPDLRVERPLRAMTMQGPRVSLACSEVVNPGRWIEYTVDFLPYLKSGSGKEAKEIDLDRFVEMILQFAQRKGRGQWRNGGNGKFTAIWKPLNLEKKTS
jgi:hypothetical protein